MYGEVYGEGLLRTEGLVGDLDKCECGGFWKV